jgi:hypothetical protein
VLIFALANKMLCKNLIITYYKMTTEKINLKFFTVLLFILIAGASRFLPFHNFTALGAISLFGAAHFNKKWFAIIITIVAAWLTDLFVNNVLYASQFPTFTWFYQGFYWQYISYALIAIAGFFILKKVTIPTVLTGALASIVIFFLVSNFGVWVSATSSYPKTITGLMECYAAAIPFVKGTILGDLIYSTVLFGGFALAQSQVPALRLAK